LPPGDRWLFKITFVEKKQYHTCHWLRVQGFTNYTEMQLKYFRSGIRFAYALCAIIVLLAIPFDSIVLLSIAAITAFFGVLLPRHPFDYLYNCTVRFAVKKSKIPKRNPQNRFACGVATFLLSLAIYLLYSDYRMAGFAICFVVISSAILASTTDICIPSIIYNLIFLKRIK
jgi:hypothetical protein